jgi:predicted O-methyltransferase YrrM
MAVSSAEAAGAGKPHVTAETPFELVGEGALWFEVERQDGGLMIRPVGPVPRRCLVRPAALFWRGRGFPDVNTIMGRILFGPGAVEPQFYRPFTKDPDRTLRGIYLLTEATPDDDLFASPARWRNYEAVAEQLLAHAGVPWSGFSADVIEALVGGEPWHQPLEGCVLHALAQWAVGRGCCVIEIGSLRGQSLAMLGHALHGAASDAVLISVDPHAESPENRDYTRLALSGTGSEGRIVQFPCTSDDAWRMLRPACASLIFVDGDHSYDQVVADFEHYRELLAPGGCLLFHDYGYGAHNGQPDVVPDVRRAIDRHVMGADAFRPLLLAHTLLAFVKRGA